MRQWHVDPEIMCTKHLLGEHVEHHMMVGTLNKKKNISGYIKKNLIEPESLRDRHNRIALEMSKRKFKHNSLLPQFDIDYLPLDQLIYKIDKTLSLQELIHRCPECRKRYENKYNKQ